MNIFNQIREQVVELISLYDAASLEKVTLEPPRDASHGDLSTNAAMILAKDAGKNPRELAEDFKKLFSQIEIFEEISVAGPGFINFRLNPNFWQNHIADIISNQQEYGKSSVGKNAKVNVEYVSTNPTGPIHIGHARGAVFGDVLASVLQASGYDVTREYYINDAGSQIETLCKSVLLRYNGATEIPEGMYPGEYVIPIAENLRAEFGEGLDEKDIAKIRPFVVEETMNLIRENLASANIRHDVFTSEFELTKAGKVEEALKLLDSKGLIYRGVLEAPKGKAPDDWEEREQTLFKSTDFGDDVDRAIKKSDDSFTYFAGDLGYHLNKIERGFTKLINVLGQDHGGYVKRIKAGVKALSDSKVECEIKLVNLVKLMQNGVPVKMSKRGGNYIFIEEVIEEVGIDALRFIMLTRKNDAPLDFDLAKVVEQSKDNPVFYVQYAHARCHSVFRQYGKEVDFTNADLSLLSNESELALIKKLAEFPRIVELAASHYEPHRIAFYLQELAAEFHSLWNAGTSDAALKFIIDDESTTHARLTLVKAVQIVVHNGLKIFGVNAPEEMK
ncbi:MAG: arginine--tRNA ligase [Alphaproteobacteria bacterium CG11_big_fil_rev_8_21_14_0_20_44_7]|nr:MAG: arginine--tRNA ligase [Alphaproteobacteria bacterium CG11_big_fil_rev_8_21_14_0_20_44_7]